MKNENIVSRLFRSFPLLADKSVSGVLLSMRKTQRNYAGSILCIAVLYFLLSPQRCQAYTVVIPSTAAAPGTEANFIAGTTNQFNATVFTNPLFPNTYQITLFGPNPNFNPPPTNQQLLSALVTVDSYTYAYGWPDGESYMQAQEANTVAFMGTLCAYATNFILNESTTTTFDKATCKDTISTVIDQIYQLQLSTPTVVPGQWQ